MTQCSHCDLVAVLASPHDTFIYKTTTTVVLQSPPPPPFAYMLSWLRWVLELCLVIVLTAFATLLCLAWCIQDVDPLAAAAAGADASSQQQQQQAILPPVIPYRTRISETSPIVAIDPIFPTYSHARYNLTVVHLALTVLKRRVDATAPVHWPPCLCHHDLEHNGARTQHFATVCLARLLPDPAAWIPLINPKRVLGTPALLVEVDETSTILKPPGRRKRSSSLTLESDWPVPTDVHQVVAGPHAPRLQLTLHGPAAFCMDLKLDEWNAI